MASPLTDPFAVFAIVVSEHVVIQSTRDYLVFGNIRVRHKVWSAYTLAKWQSKHDGGRPRTSDACVGSNQHHKSISGLARENMSLGKAPGDYGHSCGAAVVRSTVLQCALCEHGVRAIACSRLRRMHSPPAFLMTIFFTSKPSSADR